MAHRAYLYRRAWHCFEDSVSVSVSATSEAVRVPARRQGPILALRAAGAAGCPSTAIELGNAACTRQQHDQVPRAQLLGLQRPTFADMGDWVALQCIRH